jgi:hypothetical protein
MSRDSIAGGLGIKSRSYPDLVKAIGPILSGGEANESVCMTVLVASGTAPEVTVPRPGHLIYNAGHHEAARLLSVQRNSLGGRYQFWYLFRV